MSADNDAKLISEIKDLVHELRDDESIAQALNHNDQIAGVARTRSALEKLLAKYGHSKYLSHVEEPITSNP